MKVVLLLFAMSLSCTAKVVNYKIEQISLKTTACCKVVYVPYMTVKFGFGYCPSEG